MWVPLHAPKNKYKLLFPFDVCRGVKGGKVSMLSLEGGETALEGMGKLKETEQFSKKVLITTNKGTFEY